MILQVHVASKAVWMSARSEATLKEFLAKRERVVFSELRILRVLSSVLSFSFPLFLSLPVFIPLSRSYLSWPFIFSALHLRLVLALAFN